MNYFTFCKFPKIHEVRFAIVILSILSGFFFASQYLPKKLDIELEKKRKKLTGE